MQQYLQQGAVATVQAAGSREQGAVATVQPAGSREQGAVATVPAAGSGAAGGASPVGPPAWGGSPAACYRARGGSVPAQQGQVQWQEERAGVARGAATMAGGKAGGGAGEQCQVLQRGVVAQQLAIELAGEVYLHGAA